MVFVPSRAGYVASKSRGLELIGLLLTFSDTIGGLQLLELILLNAAVYCDVATISIFSYPSMTCVSTLHVSPHQPDLMISC